MKFTFSSCIGIVSDELDKGNSSEFGLCESEIILPGDDEVTPNWLFEIDLDQLNAVEIVVLKTSDGADIWERKHLSPESQQIFASVSVPFKPEFREIASKQWFEDFGVTEEDFYRTCIWYELIKLLSGGRIRCSDCENVIDYTRFVYHPGDKSSNNQMNLVMEIHSGNIVRKLSQVSLEIVQTGEIDLFLLSSRMFESQQKSNDMIYKLSQENKNQRGEIGTFIAEKKALDIILKQRDTKTSAIMVDLLNEKKQKIVELESRLKTFDHKHSDTDLINKHVTNAVSELNSPGKRKRKFGTEFRSPTSSARKRRVVRSESNNLNNVPELISERVKKEIDDDFIYPDTNKYMGINKRLDMDQFDSDEPKKSKEVTSEIKKEGTDEGDDKIEKDQSTFDEGNKSESNLSFDDFIDKDDSVGKSRESSTNSVTKTNNKYEEVAQKNKRDGKESSTEEETDASPTLDSEAETDTETDM